MNMQIGFFKAYYIRAQREGRVRIPRASSGSLSRLRWGLQCQQCEKCGNKMERVLGTKLETRQI